MMDPRSAVFEKRLKPAARIVAIGGGKGGVGKTTVASLTALVAARSGLRVGLLDLDVHGSAAHVVLGIDPRFPDEEGGILPLAGPRGIHFMSAAAFSADRPLALRGAEVTEAISELLAVTIWPALDVLVVDLPPGLGEGLLDTLKFIPRTEIVAVTTPSKPATSVSARFLKAVSPVATVLGLVVNRDRSSGAAQFADTGAPVLARVPEDEGLEAAIGDPEAMLSSVAAQAVSKLVESLLQE